jgi:hypothetical protein
MDYSYLGNLVLEKMVKIKPDLDKVNIESLVFEDRLFTFIGENPDVDYLTEKQAFPKARHTLGFPPRRSAEVFEQHNIAATLVNLREEQPAPVGRDR